MSAPWKLSTPRDAWTTHDCRATAGRKAHAAEATPEYRRATGVGASVTRGLRRLAGLHLLFQWTLQVGTTLRADDTVSAFLDSHLAQPKFAAAAWGVKVVSLASGRTLYEHDSGKLLKPASNAKLYSVALALDRLGPDFRIRTSLYSTQRPDTDGTLDGDLIVYGRGDPSFAARFHHNSHADNLGPIARAIAQAGVKKVRGDLVADESFFSGPPLGSGWMWDDLEYYYGAEVSALTVEDNVVDLILKPGAAVGDPVRIIPLPATTYLSFSNRAETAAARSGPSSIQLHRPIGQNVVYVHGRMSLDVTNLYEAVSVHEPARWFGELLRTSLVRQSVAVEGPVRVLNWLDREIAPRPTNGWVELAHVESPPLREIAESTLKPSQNLYAQLLLLQVGAWREGQSASTNTPRPSTEATALDEMSVFLAEAGIPPGEVLLEDGSGLSRGTLVTANSITRLLAYMRQHRYGDVFRGALPVAGVDGTLRRRMKNTGAAGNARAKTGTMRHVHSLSGYTTNRAGDERAFSIILNNFDGPESEARAALDTIVVRLSD